MTHDAVLLIDYLEEEAEPTRPADDGEMTFMWVGR